MRMVVEFDGVQYVSHLTIEEIREEFLAPRGLTYDEVDLVPDGDVQDWLDEHADRLASRSVWFWR